MVLFEILPSLCFYNANGEICDNFQVNLDFTRVSIFDIYDPSQVIPCHFASI